MNGRAKSGVDPEWVNRPVAMQLLALLEVIFPWSMDVVPWSWQPEKDMGAGVGLPRGKAKGRWPVQPLSTPLEMCGGVQQLSILTAGHFFPVSISLCSL